MGLKDPGEIVSFYNIYIKIRVKHNNTTFLVAQMVKNVPAMRKTWVRSLAWEDPLEKGMETYSDIIVWRFPWTEEPGGLQSMRSQKRYY